MKPAFRLYFNKNRQFVNVFFHNVHPNTFQARNSGRWGYYLSNSLRTREGLFGELHFVESRVRHDLVAHELIHLLGDFLRSKNREFSNYNEEYIAILFDSWTRRFWREWGKIKP